jgi:hypothetical protein
MNVNDLIESAKVQVQANRYALLRKVRDQKIVQKAVKAK